VTHCWLNAPANTWSRSNRSDVSCVCLYIPLNENPLPSFSFGWLSRAIPHPATGPAGERHKKTSIISPSSTKISGAEWMNESVFRPIANLGHLSTDRIDSTQTGIMISDIPSDRRSHPYTPRKPFMQPCSAPKKLFSHSELFLQLPAAAISLAAQTWLISWEVIKSLHEFVIMTRVICSMSKSGMRKELTG